MNLERPRIDETIFTFVKGKSRHWNVLKITGYLIPVNCDDPMTQVTVPEGGYWVPEYTRGIGFVGVHLFNSRRVE